MELSLTVILIAANVIISLIGFSNQKVMNDLIFYGPAISQRHQYYRFITSGFLHADYMHLFFNMFTLYFFGTALEQLLKGLDLGGNISFLLIYFLGMIIADIPSYLKHKNDYGYRSLGASGAVSAVLFATIVFTPWSPVLIFGVLKLSALAYAILYIWYCIYMSKKGGDNINHDAHLWGSLFGFSFMLVLLIALKPGVLPSFAQELTKFSLFGRDGNSEVIQYLLGQ